MFLCFSHSLFYLQYVRVRVCRPVLTAIVKGHDNCSRGDFNGAVRIGNDFSDRNGDGSKRITVKVM